MTGAPQGRAVPAAEVAALASASDRVLVVLDDDPTGTQSVANLPVLMNWTVESLVWALSQGAPAVYVMTNSRSLGPADAEQRNREVARAAFEAAAQVGVRVDFVSRSDSTLRGHFPLEPDTLAQEVLAATSHSVDGVVVIPAFGEAGRITVDAIHYAGSAADGYTPAGDTEFAKDATFGYAASDLR
ncbi:MAG: four-carbon acid sugar kinase family protein, partial [Austwickia sp.]|nr:four-carbon acid sugar kinase family protein [Austwickia sp.]